MKLTHSTTALFACLFMALGASAQSYPDKPVSLVIGYAPGGSADFTARLIAEEMGKELNAPVIVENKPGAGGNIANGYVARARPDGYTVLLTSSLEVNKILYPSSSYDADKDFIPVGRLTTSPLLILVREDSEIKNLKNLVDQAKENPKKLFNASAGFGSAPHLASTMFESVADVEFDSIQYKGGGPATMSLMAGDTDVLFAVPPTVKGFVDAQRIRPLAVTTQESWPALPGIPGAAEAGLPGYEYTFWYGLFVPTGTPSDVVQRLYDSSVAVLAQPEVREKIAAQGMDTTPSASPAAFAQEIRAEAPVLRDMLAKIGAKVE